MPVNTHRWQGHPSLGKLAQGTVCKILAEPQVKPHKVRYYLEKRDPEFGPKMAEILCVYRQVAMLRGQAGSGHNQGQDGGGDGSLAIVSYDEKPGIQAIATTAPDRPPLPGTSPTVMRAHEYKRLGTLTLMAGIDVLTGHVHALVKERHRSREFIEFLKILDAAYPADTAIEVILDNHSAHISRETSGWLAAQPIGRFTFTFTPTHGSWLNIIEGFFSKLARSVLRHIRVNSKDQLTQRLMAFINDVNHHPVVHTWRYKIDDAA
jgi:transposase